jgi:hypothetical protein
MKKILVLLVLCAISNRFNAQTVDLSSVDEFFKVTSALNEGKEISEGQWNDFDSSGGYREFAEREDKTLINIIKSSVNIAFGNGTLAEKDSILSISQEEMNSNTTLLLKKLILINYLDIKEHYDSIKSFRETYDFDALVGKAKQRLFSFFGTPIDPAIGFKPVFFLFISADGKNKEEAIYVDFNLIYKKTEEQRVDFLAHEFFHNYRELFEDHEFNYKNYLNYFIDAIQNEGIADLIDKTEGYGKYFAGTGEPPEMVETWINLYNQAPEDLERLHNLILQYSKDEISEQEMEAEIQDIVRFNGHPIGFFMANQIVYAGFKSELLETFYNPYEFYSLYNKAAKQDQLFQLSDEFLDYLKGLTKDYYQ